MKKHATITKITQWEHWPTYAYYLPLLPMFFVRFVKAGHPNHYLATNPGIAFSGNGTESKYATINLVPQTHRPKGFLFEKNSDPKTALKEIGQHELDYPLIAKPDRGFRGYLVRKINDQEQLLNYLNGVGEDILIQEFIPYEQEMGIFYHRIPGSEEGQVTSVTIKEFMRLTGDGLHSLSDLIKKDDRAFLYYDIFKSIHREKMGQILDEGEEMVLSLIGNHSKGTRFINGNHLIGRELLQIIDPICKQMEGWFYGRLDIKFRDLDSFLQGEEFKILEVNGIISEPTHIYDASHQNASFLNALRSINEHWKIMHRIALINHREHGVPYPGVIDYLKNLNWLHRYSKKLKKLNAKEF